MHEPPAQPVRSDPAESVVANQDKYKGMKWISSEHLFGEVSAGGEGLQVQGDIGYLATIKSMFDGLVWCPVICRPNVHSLRRASPVQAASHLRKRLAGGSTCPPLCAKCGESSCPEPDLSLLFFCLLLAVIRSSRAQAAAHRPGKVSGAPFGCREMTQTFLSTRRLCACGAAQLFQKATAPASG